MELYWRIREFHFYIYGKVILSPLSSNRASWAGNITDIEPNIPTKVNSDNVTNIVCSYFGIMAIKY